MRHTIPVVDSDYDGAIPLQIPSVHDDHTGLEQMYCPVASYDEESGGRLAELFRALGVDAHADVVDVVVDEIVSVIATITRNRLAEILVLAATLSDGENRATLGRAALFVSGEEIGCASCRKSRQ